MFMLGKRKNDSDAWQDRAVKFDINPKLLRLRRGEMFVDSLRDIEVSTAELR